MSKADSVVVDFVQLLEEVAEKVNRGPKYASVWEDVPEPYRDALVWLAQVLLTKEEYDRLRTAWKPIMEAVFQDPRMNEDGRIGRPRSRPPCFSISMRHTMKGLHG